jgi:hypothetical protein
MTDLVQLVSIVISAALLVTIIELVRRGRLSEEYSFIWIVCAIALFALSVWRNLLDLAASALGVHYPPAVLLLVLTFFVVIVSLYFSVVVSRHRKDIEKLVEDVALLDEQVRRLAARAGSFRLKAEAARNLRADAAEELPPGGGAQSGP